ncbi:MAG: type II secretion system protein [Clostridiaceae bacterium]|nr:type II secretion system protein [Clostridiaceae bacterium]
MTEKLVSMRNKKGFTLVELLVVIVIMCILAAILIPTFAKYIDKAENATIVAEARAAHVALSVVCQEKVMNDPNGEGNGEDIGVDDVADAALALAGVEGEITTVSCNEDGTVTGFTYNKGGKSVTWASPSNQYVLGEVDESEAG